MRIALAVFAAAGGNDLISVMCQVLEHELLPSINQQRPGRDFDHQVIAALALLVRSAAGGTRLRLPKSVMRQGGQVIDTAPGDHNDAAAIAAVAAIGSAVWDVLLAPEADAAVATAASLDFDSDAIDEH